jgi:hypothetical protein
METLGVRQGAVAGFFKRGTLNIGVKKKKGPGGGMSQGHQSNC